MNQIFLNSKSKFKQGILKNDMKYIYNINNFYKSVSIIIYIRVGSKHENKKEEGLAHFLEHMLFKGTKQFKNNLLINKRIDEINASINASTHYNFTNYYITLPSKYLLEGLELLNEIVYEALLDSKELEKEKNVVIEEINANKDNTIEYCSDLLMLNLYKQNNLGHFVLGNKKNIKSLTRNNLLKFYNKFYTHNNSCISISGDIPKNIVNILNKIFFNKTTLINNNLDINKLNIQKINIEFKKPKIICHFRKREQIVIGLAFPIFDLYDKRKHELDLLVNILYGSMTSKLWLALRDINPIVYGLHVDYTLLEEGGALMIRLSFEKKKLSDCFKYLFYELNKIKKQIVNNNDFIRLKNIELNNLAIYNNETFDIAEYYGEQLILEEPIESYNKIKKITNKINSKNIKRLCNEILNFENCLLIQIGDIPKNNLEKLFYKYIN